MAEGGAERPVYYINTQSLNIVAQRNIEEVNVNESVINEISAPTNQADQTVDNGDSDLRRRQNTESDAAEHTSVRTTSGLRNKLSSTPGYVSKGSSNDATKTDFNDAPTGAGWIKLSEKIYMFNAEPMKKGAKVYKGKQKCGDEWRDVAIKLIPYDQKNLNEIKMLLKMEGHPNIIRMFDAGSIHEALTPQIYIVMELCFQTLKDYIDANKGKEFDFEKIFSFAKQIVAGVVFIHKKKILHRDLKLENILVTPLEDFIRVADFGLSKQLDEMYSVASVSSRGLGTEGYRAPEMHHENPKASFRTDSFSLGVVLVMLFSGGRHPFGPDPFRWRTNIIEHKGLDLSHIFDFNQPHTHKKAQLLDLIKKCLKPNPRSRPTAKEMLQHPFFATDADIPLHSKGTLLKNLGSRFRSLFKESSRQTNMKEIKTEIPGKWEEQSEDTTYRFKSLSRSDDHLRKENGPVDQLLLGKKKKIEHLENELGKCLRKGEIKKYCQILKELKELRQSHDLDVILDLVEYELVSQNDESSIEKVRHYISSSGWRSSSDVRKKGYELQQQGHYVQAMILYKMSHNLHKKEKKLSPDDELKWICNHVTHISYAIEPLIKAGGKSRDIGNKYGTTYMEELFEELRQVSDATPDARALNELSCRVNITAINTNLGEYEKSIRIGEDGVTMMKEHFGEKVSNYKRFGWLLHNLGISYRNSGQYERAEHCYVTAIEVKEKALDYENEEKRQENIASTQRSLANTRRKLVSRK